MTGTKGRSGKVTTLAHKQARAAAGAKGGLAKAANASAPPVGRSDVTDPTSDDPVKRLGKPVTWGDELKRAQVDGERTQNRRREIEVKRAEVELQRAKTEADEARGKLVEKAELDAAVKKVRDAWWREAQQIAGASLLRLAALPAEARASVKAAIEAETAAAASRVKDAMQ